MIKLQNINFEYGGGKKVFDNFCTEFESGKISCILGGSGAGKTTLLNLLAGLLEPQGGSIEGLVNGISYVFQEPRLIPNLTVFDNLDFVLHGVYKDKAVRTQKIIEALDSVGILETKNKFPSSLSGGMAQRVSLVRAFLYPSDIMLLDEPFVGLDVKTKDSIIKMFLSLFAADKKTVVYVTHDIEDALALSGDIFILKTANGLEAVKERSLQGLKDLILKG